MELKYEYYFVKHGVTREDHSNINNEIWLDVGNKIAIGTFDHHNAVTDYQSTVDTLFNELDLLEQTKNQLDESAPVRIFTHEQPDTDAFFGIYFLKKFLETGREQFEKEYINTGLGNIFKEYVNDIDRGKNKDISETTLYALICNLDLDIVKEKFSVTNSADLYNKQVEKALNWIEQTIKSEKEALAQKSFFNIYRQKCPFVEEDTIARVIDKHIKEENYTAYIRDKKENRLVFENISIWTQDGKTESVLAAIWKDVPTSPNSAYIFARKEGAVITFVPHIDGDNKGAFISVNPDIDGAVETYSLKEVGEMYEQLEQIYDKKQYDETGSLNRDYSEPRGDGKSYIFLNKPFSMTKDPWYVSEKGDVVDSPGIKGSLIPIEEMIEVLRSITKMVKKSYVVDFDLDLIEDDIRVNVSSHPKANESILHWTDEIASKLNNTSDRIFPLVVAEVDAAMISHNYNILDAYYMKLTGGGYIDLNEDNVFRIDYRTHLYINQAYGVLFIATSEKTDKNNLIGSLLDVNDEDNILNSPIIKIISKILYQRESFKSLGRFIGDFEKRTGEINKKNAKLIRLLARAQKDECIDNQIELDVYNFIYTGLQVDKLKNDVQESMNFVMDYTKEEVYGKINALSTITIPAIIISTFFQAGVISIPPIFSPASEIAGVCWIVVLVIILVITKLFMRRK
ncbi:MAG: hypothetical protein E7273_09455 [Pseudobutyrivibrio ruminis]|nr:hypothetical protein [Pseudobutyrivibrio ruminis]